MTCEDSKRINNIVSISISTFMTMGNSRQTFKTNQLCRPHEHSRGLFVPWRAFLGTRAMTSCVFIVVSENFASCSGQIHWCSHRFSNCSSHNGHCVSIAIWQNKWKSQSKKLGKRIFMVLTYLHPKEFYVEASIKQFCLFLQFFIRQLL